MKKTSWYHIEDLPEYPAINLEMLLQACQRMTDFGFANIGPSLQRYRNGAGPLYVAAKAWDRASKEYVQAIVRQPGLYVLHHRRLLSTGRKLQIQANNVRRLDVRTLTNAQLAHAFQSIQALATDLHVARGPGWIMEQRFERFSQHLLQALRQHFSRNHLMDDPVGALTVLSTPRGRFKTNEETESLLRLACKSSVSQQALKAHLAKYWYVTYGMVGPGLTLSELKTRIRAARSEGAGVELKRRRNQRANLIRDRERLLRRLHLPTLLRSLVKIAGWIGAEKAWSKEIQYYGQVMRDKLLKEMCRRYRLTLRQMRWMLPTEITGMLRHKSFPLPRELDRRWRDSWLLITPQGMTFLFSTKAQAFLKGQRLEIKPEVPKSVSEFRGRSAFRGKATGAVKIIEYPADIRKMRHGNILVSTMTIAEIVPAMRLASAILTDEGGLTCHAAIISRELGIPCIIGTKIATRVLKDGDQVEVDAVKGTVKKL